MARMYAKVKGSSLNSAFTKSGNRFKNNKNIGVDIDIARLTNIVYREVMKKIKTSPDAVAKMDDTTPKNPKDKKAKQHGHWKLSEVGFSILAGQIVSSVVSESEAYASGDNAQIAMTNYTNLKGTSTLLLSTFGGPVGMVMATALNRIEGLVGQYVKNQIQLQYDNARLDYNLTTMDIGRNSTYTYDYEQNKWVARDVQRIRNNVLNQNVAS